MERPERSREEEAAAAEPAGPAAAEALPSPQDPPPSPDQLGQEAPLGASEPAAAAPTGPAAAEAPPSPAQLWKEFDVAQGRRRARGDQWAAALLLGAVIAARLRIGVHPQPLEVGLQAPRAAAAAAA